MSEKDFVKKYLEDFSLLSKPNEDIVNKIVTVHDILVNAQKNNPDSSVLRINLANAYIEAGKYQQSIQILNRYTYDHPDDTNGWALLAKSYAKLGNRAAELASFGELLALRAQWDKAINNYMQAAQMAKLGSMEQARYDARIDQLRFQRQEFKALQ